MDYFTEDHLWHMIAAESKQVSQKELSARLNITPQYLNDILRQRRSISPVVAKALGFKRVVLFQREPEE